MIKSEENTTASSKSFLSQMRSIQTGAPSQMSSIEESSHSSNDLSDIPSYLPRGLTRRSRSARLAFWVVIELGWLVLAAICHLHPIQLDRVSHSLVSGSSSGHDKLLRGVWSAISNVWQGVAAFFLRDIIVDSLSGEWSRLIVTRPLHGGHMQQPVVGRVSVITAGLFDQVGHLFGKRKSGAFIITFGCSVAIMLLGYIAPGAVTVGVIDIPQSISLTIGALHGDSDYQADSQSVRAASALIQQYITGCNAGFRFPPNYMTALPSLDKVSSHLTYVSDVIHHNFTCTFMAPKLALGFGGLPCDKFSCASWKANGSAYTLDWELLPDQFPKDIDSLYPSQILGAWPASAFLVDDGTTDPGAAQGLLRWLIVGDADVYNDKRRVDISAVSLYDQVFNATSWAGLRQSFIPGSVGYDYVDGINATTIARSVTLLLCDPRFTVSSAHIHLDNGQVSIGDSLPDTAAVGNIDAAAVAQLFTTAFRKSLWVAGRSSSAPVSEIMRRMFFDGERFLSDESIWDEPIYTLQTVQNISAYLGDYVAAASTVWLDTSWDTASTDGTETVLRLALQTSLPQWIVASCLALVVLMLGVVLVMHEDTIPLTADSAAAMTSTASLRGRY